MPSFGASADLSAEVSTKAEASRVGGLTAYRHHSVHDVIFLFTPTEPKKMRVDISGSDHSLTPKVTGLPGLSHS
jgi:hypothetical protein